MVGGIDNPSNTRGIPMFKREDKTSDDFDITGFIGEGMKVEGTLSFEKTVRIDGSFKGDITSSGTLVVGESGFVEGNVRVGRALINGEVKGTVDATERVELQSPARLCGDIKTPTLIIGEGTAFDGKCVMLKGGAGTAPANGLAEVEDTFRDLMKQSG